MKKNEILNARRRREKHFLREDGIIEAYVYDRDIHFLNNNVYDEIDNTLIEENEEFHNKRNAFKATFNKNNLLKVEKDNFYLVVNINNNKINFPKKIKKNKDIIEFNKVFNNIDIDYNLEGEKIKESIILKDKEDVLEKIVFNIDTNLLLSIKDNKIYASNGTEDIFIIEKPFMVDNKGIINNNIFYNLNNNKLELMLDRKWLLDNAREYPVIIDPTITNSSSENNVYDTFIYEGDTNVDRNNQQVLLVGVDSSNKVYRSLLKFELPTIGTGSQIINAYVNLIGYPVAYNSPTLNYSYIDAYKVTTDWDESTANWNTMHDKYDSRMETYSYYYPSKSVANEIVDVGYNTVNITNLVKKWYSGEPNYGIMLKAHVENTDLNDDVCRYFSKNNTVTGDNPKPLLIITYRNANGLEDYMSYQNISFAEGSTYINSYNGNLISAFDIISTIGGKFPSNIVMYYNTNDVVLNNNYGYGLGYKLNYHQLIKEVTIDNTNYLEYLDEDGTLHYFNKNTDDSKYYDEDNLNLTIEKLNNLYVMTNKYGESLEFTINNNIGYLTKITNSDNLSHSIEYDNLNRITKVTDGNSNTINISYDSSKITFNTTSKTTIVNCNNDYQMISLVKDNNTTSFSYNNLKLIEYITDINSLQKKYEYYSTIPYRLKKITEYGLNNTLGKSVDITYDFNVTAYKDNLGRKNTFTFNNLGNSISESNLDIGETLKEAMGKNNSYIDFENIRNLLLNTEPLNKTVKNFINNSSFEGNNDIFYATGLTKEFSSEIAHSGSKSLKLTGSGYLYYAFPVSENDSHYTFSGYYKGTGKAKIYVEIHDENTLMYDFESEEFDLTDEFVRHEFSVFLPNEYAKGIDLYLYFTDATAYIDDLQLEKGEVANLYNLIDNGDFSSGTDGWSISQSSSVNSISPSAEVVELETGLTALKLKRDPYITYQLTKEFDINGKAGDVYYLSFWYKNATMQNNYNSDWPANCLIAFNYTNQPDDDGHGLIPDFELNFNENEWQYFSTVYSAEYDYDKVIFTLFAENMANEFYITNFFMTKDLSMISYNYDDNSNLTNIYNLNKKETKFKYNDNNRLIEIATPLGNNLSYEYDNQIKDRVLSSISSTGITNEIKYDSFGNPIVVKAKATSEEAELSGKYYIRLKGTEKYLDCNYPNKTVSMVEDNCSNETFEIIKEQDYYLIKSVLNPNYYLGYIDNKLYLVRDQNNAKFNITKNTNNNYYINIYNDYTKYLKYDNNTLVFNNLDRTNPNYEFYFHNSSSPLFIENTATYTDNGKFIKTTTDTLFNTTEYDVNTNNGLINSIKDANDKTTNYTYNNKEQITKVEKEGKEVNYTYNNQNQLSKIRCSNKDYNFTYDNFLNTKSIKIGENITLITNDYEERNGKLIKSTYGNNDVLEFSYDDFERIKKITKETENYNFKYDNFNNVAKIEVRSYLDYLLHTYLYEYDLAQRLINYTYDNFKLNYTYNDDDNITKKIYTLDNITKTKEFTYNNEQELTQSIIDDTTINYNYDSLGRLTSKLINNTYETKYGYVTNGNRTSLILDSISNGDNKYSYKYDSLYNITHIYYNDELINEYYYDKFNQLIKEDDYRQNKTFKYVYDSEGNILRKNTYEFKTSNLLNTINYEYNNSNWQDQLTKYDNTSITYDGIGNPLTIGTANLTWVNGRVLQKYEDNTNNLVINYEYNKDNIRTSKTINNVKTNYYLENKNIIFEQTGTNMIYYLRDSNSKLIGLKYNNNLYYYLKNIQDDIIGLLDSNYNLVAQYLYDSWGNIISIKDNSGNEIADTSNIAHINPYRYRSYYYDKETKLYYLNSRYYNPAWGRFINADGIINADEVINGFNLYAYTINNPIVYKDNTGMFLKAVDVIKAFRFIGKAFNYTIASFTQNIRPSASEAMKGAILGASSLSPQTQDRLIEDIKKSKEFRDVVKEEVPKKKSDYYSYGSSYFTGGTDLHLAIGKYDYELYWKKSRIPGLGDDVIWEVKVHIWDDYDFDEESVNYKSVTGIFNAYGYFLQNKEIITPYRWDLNFTYIYVEVK